MQKRNTRFQMTKNGGNKTCRPAEPWSQYPKMLWKNGIFRLLRAGELWKTRLTNIVLCVIIKHRYVSKALTKRVPVFLSAKRAGDGGSPAGRCTAKITSELQGEGVCL